MSVTQIRTDLALEAHENMGNAESTHGVLVDEFYRKKSKSRITKVKVTTKNGAKAIGKPMGSYITIESPGMPEPDEDYHREISVELAKQVRELIPDPDVEKSFLVIGLGNRDVTADALGPNVIDNLFITRHVIKAYGKAAYNKEKMHMISSLAPGVMAKNGMETEEIIKGVVTQTCPDVVLVVDALAARSTKRLNRTIQVTDTGIQPGSGVGNHRNAISIESLGVPVIAIGVPTVVDAATIVCDALDQMNATISDSLESEQNIEKAVQELHNMYVTSKDIDATVKRLGFTISEALNIAFEM